MSNPFQILSEQGMLALKSAKEVHHAHQHAIRELDGLRARLYWKSSNGSQYLISTHCHNGIRKRHSLGRRSYTTECIFQEHSRNADSARDRLRTVQEQYCRQRQINRSMQLGEAHPVLISILKRAESFCEDTYLVIGSQALHAYGAKAAVRFTTSAPGAPDLFGGDRDRLILGVQDPILAIKAITRADRTFALMSDHECTLRNARGYEVGIIARPQGFSGTYETKVWSDDQAFWSDSQRDLNWLICAPRLTGVVIATDGNMCEMKTVDPRAFVLHNQWLSNQVVNPGGTVKLGLLQARAVAAVIEQHLLDLPFEAIKLPSPHLL